MSKESALAFRDAVGSTPEIQEHVRSILTNGAADDELASLGKQHGYEFTADEAREVVDSLGSTSAELNDFELEMVSGGLLKLRSVDERYGGGGGGSSSGGGSGSGGSSGSSGQRGARMDT